MHKIVLKVPKTPKLPLPSDIHLIGATASSDLQLSDVDNVGQNTKSVTMDLQSTDLDRDDADKENITPNIGANVVVQTYGFKCGVANCPTICVSEDHLLYHKRRVHRDVNTSRDEPRQRCWYCNEMITAKLFKKHVQQRHGVKRI